MKMQTAPAISPERMFLRASLRSIDYLRGAYNLTSATMAPNSRARYSSENRYRRSAVRRSADERASQHDRTHQVDAAERARTERELRDRVQQQRVQQDLAAGLVLAAD